MKFNIGIIKSEKEYNLALQRMEVIFDSKSNSKEGKEAELLALLIEIEAIKIRMDELQLKQKDLVGVIGTKSIVSEVLNRKRKLTVNMIRVLSDKLKLTAQVLVQDYKLVSR